MILPILPCEPDDKGRMRPTREPTPGEMWQAKEMLKPKMCSWPYGDVVSRQTGLPCRATRAAGGSSRCRSHGGASPRGLASPVIKHGRYSKALTPAVLSDMASALRDPEPLDLQQDIAVLTMRIADLMSRLQASAGPTAWRQMESIISAAQEAMAKAAEDGEGYTPAEMLLERAAEMSDAANIEEDIWPTLINVIKERAKLVETEHKRQTTGSQVMTKKQVLDLIEFFVKSVERHCSDRTVVQAVCSDLARVLQSRTIDAVAGNKQAIMIKPLARK